MRPGEALSSTNCDNLSRPGQLPPRSDHFEFDSVGREPGVRMHQECSSSNGNESRQAAAIHSKLQLRVTAAPG